MDFKANIETRESVEAKAKAALGFDLSSALDLVNRTDYSSVEQYLDAAAKAELERSSPEYRAARKRLEAEYNDRLATRHREIEAAAYKTMRQNVILDSVDKHNIAAEAAERANRDLYANRISKADLADTISRYEREASEKVRDSKASNALFNAMLRGQL